MNEWAKSVDIIHSQDHEEILASVSTHVEYNMFEGFTFLFLTKKNIQRTMARISRNISKLAGLL
jgi:hypothetical protein